MKPSCAAFGWGRGARGTVWGRRVSMSSALRGERPDRLRRKACGTAYLCDGQILWPKRYEISTFGGVLRRAVDCCTLCR